ncbi:hypothetical protein [Thermomonospora umbrina]|uniref:Uncharacterized protein n=1 Tax=Thermomonospora umbrina TaxID=111806 RepID=A0A3D9T343_9ACTN|nr:hypothetical protein [Thermomonospora umbrina]REE98241.1 hypothetical protein DFJ69_3725 [Thermomonospora umbrina]
MSGSTGGSLPKSLIVAVMWLAVGLMPILFELTDLRLAFGNTGTPGQVNVTSCTDLGDERYDCRGDFIPDAPGGAKVSGIGLPPDSDEGDSFPARLSDDGDTAHPTGTLGILQALAVPALGFVILVPFPWGLAYMFAGRAPGVVSGWAMMLLAGAGGLVCLAGLIVA